MAADYNATVNATVNGGANTWKSLGGDDIREIMGILALLKFRQGCGKFLSGMVREFRVGR